jgi:rhodanese-related sulfurtransferase
MTDQEKTANQSVHQVPDSKQTCLGLYVTAKEAYEMWKADPEKVRILDVRTTEEFLFVGHPPMAWNIPAFLQSYLWDADKRQFPMLPNPDFVSQVKEAFDTDDVLLVTCRSGPRGCLAVNKLATAGFKNAYNIIDGIEGDMVTDSENVFCGHRMKNGWINSGLPWTCEIVPERVLVPKSR